MMVIILSRLRFKLVKAHRFDLTVVRPTSGARRVAVERELSTDRTGMPARSCVCHRSHSLE